MSIRVKMEPKKVNMVSPNKKKYTVVTGCTLKLTDKGGGTPPANGSDAVLEFWELPGEKKDAAKAGRLIGSITATFEMKGDVPHLTATAVMITFEEALVGKPNEPTTDFSVSIAFDAANFDNFLSPMSLRLPWEVEKEVKKMELGIRLVVDGNEVASTKVNDQLDIPLKHEEVPEDGTIQTELLTCFGVRTVYPEGNHMLTSKQTVKFSGKSIRVFLHESIEAGCNNIHSGSYDLTDLTNQITATLKSGGFTSVSVTEEATQTVTTGSTTTQEVGNIWIFHAGTNRFVAKNITNPNTIFTTGVTATEGQDIGSFDYWIFYNDTLGSSEAGASEALNPNAPFDAKARTKRVLTPVVLAGGGSFDSAFQAANATNRMNFVANVITHEIGHSLGLHHAVRFNGSSYSLGSGLGVMNSIGVHGGVSRLSMFSPVEKAVVKKHFL